LASLPHPPFELAEKHYFDPEVLASYIVSTGCFQNPKNRQPITLEDCVQLDHHLADNRLRACFVADAFGLAEQLKARQHEARTTEESTTSRARVLQREATVMLHSLFDFGHGVAPAAAVPPSRGWADLAESSQVEGNMALIDDDAAVLLSAHEVLPMAPPRWTPEVEATRKRLIKKIRQVEELRTKQQGGETLNADQAAKLEGAAALQAELIALPEQPEGVPQEFPEIAKPDAKASTSTQPKGKQPQKSRKSQATATSSQGAWGNPGVTQMVAETAAREKHVGKGLKKGQAGGALGMKSKFSY